ncbi:MAG: NAD-dependent epimerase/dehydratase family protein, partial [Gemmatimonadetes bacterium]|nr:NAD-dependent epimerase/dehydratase family protein [Gemmatimonadota bacterium]
MKRILITGAAGQIGTELASRLRDRYGPGMILPTDIRDPGSWASLGPAEQLDCLDLDALRAVVKRFGATDIFHLAAILSAAAEENPLRAYQINMGGLVNVLQVAAEAGCRVFTPSSIAAFGPETPRDP